TYNVAGNYQVTLTVYATNGDSAICIKNVTVVPLPQADFTMSNDTVCQFETVFFNDASTSVNDSIVDWLWFYDTAGAVTTQAQYAFPTSGNFQVLLMVTNSNGCTDSITKTVVVQPGPLSNFNVLNTCLGNAVLFTNTTFTAGLNATYSWSFGDGNQSTDINPQHAFAWVDSSYFISLTTQTSNGCVHTYFDSIAITQPANISISLSADTICKNESVTIINSSTYSGNAYPVKTEWYFSDGSVFTNVDTLQHAFTQDGVQSVMLLITTPTACDTVITKSIYVLPNPTASFTTTQVCLGDSTLLASTAFAPSGDFITAHSWLLGNGMQATDSITKVLYDSAAAYQVWHTVSTANGCTDSTMGYANVYQLPVANFSIPVAVCNDSLTSFIDFSLMPTDTIVNWNWNFGNGITDSTKNGQVQFQNAGNYNVQLTVTSSKGCIGDTVKAVTVKPSPMPAFVTANNCFNDYMQFSFVNMAPNQGLINQWQWNFGEQGALSVLENPLHKYAAPGTFIVTVTVTDTNLCFASVQQNVVVNALPNVGFTVAQPCNQTSTIFTDTSIANGIAGLEWNIQGQTFTTNTVNFLFDNAGTYPIVLTIVSDSSCTNTLQQNVVIHNMPQASFTTQPLYAMPMQTVNFTNSSLFATHYEWSFGNGLSSTDLNPTTVYNDTGNYLNQLIAKNDYGCADTIQQVYNILYPRFEVALTDVYYSITNNLLNVSSRLINLGNLPVAEYDMVLRVDGLPELFEMSNKTLPVGGQPVVYDFKSQIALTDFFDATYFCAEISLPDGMVDDQINNKKCSALDAKWQILQIWP
ncbi:MAG TPA: PKD domain-containing protein, partial [Bacteroidia bacterium]|nr:PKD domain-containing protein [Bacteroidia bacterium]